jgi:class 3 adenylate cyclase
LSTANRRRLLYPFLLIGSAWLAAHLCFWLLPNVFEPWNAQTVDQLFVLRNALEHLRLPYDNTVVHVDLNNRSIQRLNNFYLNRTHHAQVVRNLAAMGVAAQAHDFIFAARSRAEEDNDLIAATEAAGQVYFGLSLALEKSTPVSQRQPVRAEDLHYLAQTAWRLIVQGDARTLYTGSSPLVTFSPLAAAARGLGYLSVTADRDGVYRRIPLLVRYGEAFYPSFALRVACDYLRVPPEHIIVQPGRRILLRQAQRPGAAVPHDVAIPIDHQGNMVINYLGPWERLNHYNLADILLASGDREELELWSEELAGKIVLVADTSTGSSDVGAMPLDANFPLSGLHTNIIHTIITERFLRELPPLEMLAIEALLVVVGLALAWWLTSHWVALGTFLVAVGYVGFVVLGFLYGQIICNVVRPLLMVTFATIALVVHRYINEERARLEGLRQRDFVRDIFGRYLSNAVVEEILGSPRGLEMGGELRRITLLVSDLRGFTSLSARLSPREVIAVLNRYFERMIDIIARYRGTVDELMGDGMLVFFGAPLAAPDDPERAVACALEMQLALVDVNAELRTLQLPELAMGIGINTGEVVVGNIGSVKRSKYGAVGSAINTAYRIESHTVGGQILISPSTYDRVRSLVHVRGTLQAQFKGLDQPVTLYNIGGIGGTYQLTLPEKLPETFVPLTPPLPLACFPIEEKVVSQTAIPGRLTHLAGSAARATLEGQVAAYSNVKLLLTPTDGPQLSDVYAKILALEPSDTGTSQVRLEFTSLPEVAKTFLAMVGQASPVP